ncbi:MAG: hypothetical protein LQ351_002440 [Letrouitia transgressa]|nr:MAG: hypothetical protein LQ351_002440 [Letrouitia transgressa]
MSSNVGLSTPRGSGTSGYVQRNLSHLKPRDAFAPYPTTLPSHKQRQPDAAILEHDRLREIEVQVFNLRDKLEDESVDEAEIEAQTDALRRKLLKEADERKIQNKNKNGSSARGLKAHQVHELAAAKIEESEKLRKALGIREDYEEGAHWRRQEERLRDGVAEREQEKRERY